MNDIESLSTEARLWIQASANARSNAPMPVKAALQEWRRSLLSRASETASEILNRTVSAAALQIVAPAVLKQMHDFVRERSVQADMRMLASVLTEGVTDRYAQAEAVFRFATDKVKYVPDPLGQDMVFDPLVVAVSRMGDCDCKATLLATLLETLGIHTRFVRVKGHVFVQMETTGMGVPDAVRGAAFDYDDELGSSWLALEAAAPPGTQVGFVDSELLQQSFSEGVFTILDNRTGGLTLTEERREYVLRRLRALGLS